ncbi:MAG: cupin domain-containing protein [Methylocella sp.]|nr:MAG: cupin [Hyphomicrobiales bacterium]
MTSPIVNIADIEMLPRPPTFAPKGVAAERYEAKMGFVGRKIGAKALGYNVTTVPPGKRAFPFHNHQVNEEMFFVLAGTGEIRIGVETFPIRQGDVICCPAGGPETAHQIMNTGSEELRYLAVSTQQSPEITEYPDSGRFGLLAQLATNEGGAPRTLMFVGRETDSLNYWDGE